MQEALLEVAGLVWVQGDELAFNAYVFLLVCLV